jgi:hypothetical protein
LGRKWPDRLCERSPGLVVVGYPYANKSQEEFVRSMPSRGLRLTLVGWSWWSFAGCCHRHSDYLDQIQQAMKGEDVRLHTAACDVL